MQLNNHLVKLQELRRHAEQWFKQLTQRERTAVLLAGAALILTVIVLVVKPIRATFVAQSRQLAKYKSDIITVAELSGRYKKLAARRDAVEEYYQKVQISEGVRSYVESLIQGVAKVQPGGYRIKPGEEKPLGDKYEQVMLSVSFDSENFDNIVAFLSQVVKGRYPLVLSKLEIDRSRRQDKLDVNVDLKSIRALSR